MQYLDCNEIYLNVIPRDTPKESEGPWRNIWSFGFGLASTYDPYQKVWVNWEEDQTDILWRYLHSRGLIIGYNLRGFDFEILSFLGDTINLPKFDLMKTIEKAGYPRVSMKNLAINNGYCPPSLKLSSVVKYLSMGNSKLALEHLHYEIRLFRTFVTRIVEGKDLNFWNPDTRKKEKLSAEKLNFELEVTKQIAPMIKSIDLLKK